MHFQKKHQGFGGLWRLAVVAGIWIGAANSGSGALVFDLGDIISASGTPGAPPPWLRATITQDGPDSVRIKMEALSLVTSPTPEAVKSWAFNLNPTIPISGLSALEVSRTGSFQPNPILALTSANGYSGFSFDFDFDFATAGGDALTRFTDGDSVTMKLTRAAGLAEADFNFFAAHTGRDFYSGAHIISLADGKSAFVGAATAIQLVPAVAAVPEASTIIAAVLLLLPFGASTVRILRKHRAA